MDWTLQTAVCLSTLAKQLNYFINGHTGRNHEHKCSCQCQYATVITACDLALGICKWSCLAELDNNCWCTLMFQLAQLEYSRKRASQFDGLSMVTASPCLYKGHCCSMSSQRCQVPIEEATRYKTTTCTTTYRVRYWEKDKKAKKEAKWVLRNEQKEQTNNNGHSVDHWFMSAFTVLGLFGVQVATLLETLVRHGPSSRGKEGRQAALLISAAAINGSCHR